MSKIYTDNQHYSDIADAIRSKNGSSDTYLPSEMADAIMDISSGGGEEDNNADVIFFDYDGTILYTYTAEEALNLTELPELPYEVDDYHYGEEEIEFEGWNYTLDQVKDTVQKCGKCFVGTMYVPVGGGVTIINCEFVGGNHSPYLIFTMGQGSGVINWGDNATTNISGSSNWPSISKSHTYSSDGTYRIKIINNTATVIVRGGVAITKLLSKSSSNITDNLQYSNAIKSINFGTYLGAWSSANILGCCGNMKAVSINKNIDPGFVVPYAFINCGITSFSMPYTGESTNTMSNYAFCGCYSLKKLSLPFSTTTIGAFTFALCKSLKEIVIPSSITSIGMYAFNGCELLDIYMTSSTPPTLGTLAFGSLSEKSVIHIPKNSLEAYQTATNWSTYASYMQEKQ